MFLYMVYFVTMQIMSFFMVGSFYVSIKLFFQNYFIHITDNPKFADSEQFLYRFFNGQTTIGFSTLFSYGYVILLVFTCLVSLAVPIDRAVSYFRIIASIFSVLTILSLMGISIFLIEAGFYPPEEVWNPATKKLEPTGNAYFSLLTLSGCIMLGIYFLPMILRPIDFAQNFVQYSVGLVSYILLLPTFINVMQVYSMCNLHDISWA